MPTPNRHTVPLILLLITAGGFVLTTGKLGSYLMPQANNYIERNDQPSAHSTLQHLFDAIGNHPNRHSGNTYNYCQAARPASQTYPTPEHKDAVLVNTQVFVRHGDRTPVAVQPLDLGLHWECANMSAFSFTGPATDQDEKAPFQYANVVSHQVVTIPSQSPFAHRMWKGSCIPGQLTPVGAWQHRALGAALREVYIDQLKFLPPTFDPSTVYLRSTDLWRTKQSAENFMAGLYGAKTTSNRGVENTPPVLSIHTLPIEVDYLTMNAAACPRVNQLHAHIEKHSKVMQQLKQDNEKLRAKLTSLLGSDLRWSAYMDTILPRICHGLPLQCAKHADSDQEECITTEIVTQIMENVGIQTAEMGRDADNVFDLLQLGIGPLTKDIKDNLLSAKEKSSRVLFSLYSGHDTTLTPLLGMLNAADM
ncbi:Acid phosphatase-like protein 2, partial [Podila epigama]